MKKLTRSFALMAVAFVVGGCLPEEAVWWSPDGQTAAVRTDEGLRLARSDGRLSGVILPGKIQSAAWLPDSSRLVVSRSFAVPRWEQAESMLAPEEAAATMQMARAVPDLLKAGLMATGGSAKDLDEKFLAPLGMTRSTALASAWTCALSLYRDQLRAALDGFTNAAALEAELFVAETNGIPLHDISLLTISNGFSVGEPRRLACSLGELVNPVLSPRWPILAFQTGEGTLRAMTLDGKGSLLLTNAEGVRCLAWSADGRSLIHVVKEESAETGEIRRCMVVNDTGELLSGAPQVETLALAVFARNTTPRLSVLPDGRLLFASLPVTLPARTASVHPAARFFLLDLTQPEAAPVPVQVKEGSLPDDLSAFAASPDGRYVAVVEGGSDAVAVLDLSSGRAKLISPPHSGWKSGLIPAWRSSNELTFAALPSATATRPELTLWRLGGSKAVLSAAWPDSVVKPWLEAPRSDAEQPPH